MLIARAYSNGKSSGSAKFTCDCEIVSRSIGNSFSVGWRPYGRRCRYTVSMWAIRPFFLLSISRVCSDHRLFGFNGRDRRNRSQDISNTASTPSRLVATRTMWRRRAARPRKFLRFPALGDLARPDQGDEEKGRFQRAEDAAGRGDAVNGTETMPELCSERSSRRIAKGEYIPNNVIGKNMIASAAARLPSLISSIFHTENWSTGSAKAGNSNR